MKTISRFRFFGILPRTLLGLLFSTCIGEAAASGTVTAFGIYSYFSNSGNELLYAPIVVPSGLTNAVAVAAGMDYSLALKSDGTVVGWVSDGSLLTNLPPNLTNVVAIAAGEYHSLALNADGRVVAWGQNSSGETDVPSDLTNAVAIACGVVDSLALRADGTVSVWGANFAGQTNVPSGLSNVVAIAAGGWKALALKADGTVVAWGSDSFGDTQVPSDLTNVVAIAAGFEHSLALKRDGTVVTWGSNAYGLANIPSAATNVVAIAAGESHSLALKADGSVVAWGANHKNQIAVPNDMTNGVAIAGGAYHSLAIVNDGSPWIARQPLNEIAYSGTTAEFTVGAVGLPKLSYQWQRNGSAFAVTTNGFLTLTNVQPADAGSYCVVVTNSLGTIVSSKAVLTVVTSAPIILESLTDQTVLGGSNATFSISVTGSLPMSYQWQFNGTNLYGATGNPLVLTNIQMGQAGAYSFIVSNSYGVTISSNAALDVLPFVISNQPASQTVLAGTTPLFSVAAVGQSPFQYQWQLNGVNLPNATNNPLVLTNVQLDQAGIYSAVVSNIFGASASSNAVLNVLPLVVTNQPQNQTVLAGATATFSIVAGGQNPFRYQWRYNSVGIDSATNQLLTLTNVQPNQAGAYSVAISNQFGGAISSNAILTVLPLAISGQPQSQSVAIGATVSFNVTASGQGPFSYQWQYQGADLAVETNSSLILTNVQTSQSGAYSVRVSNSFGSATSSNANLTVTGIWVWGSFYYNNLSLTNIPASATNIIAMAAGDTHCLALKADGTVVAWGYSSSGQTNVPPGLSNVVSIAAGSTHSLALRNNGTLSLWGRVPPFGNPALGTVPADATNIVGLALGPGAQHAFVLRSDG
ncbi:MAG TPA: immunoglobulin domain-containing protein, partial [Candidatus Paceibacterota bacterium]|nr:immunoglobulin domain-containing protein [Candidatus Paceibacterota bacterium]